MTRLTNDIESSDLRRPRLTRRLAMILAATEYARVAQAISELSDEDWAKPTACPAWDVRQLSCHVIGMAAMMQSPWETARQQRKAAAYVATNGGGFTDALTALQVTERADWTSSQVVEGARMVGPKAARGRKLTPSIVRRRSVPEPQLLNGAHELWSLGYLIDTILTRDPWMHRSDLAAATGRPMLLTADHDGAIVADVVAEWAARHRKPYNLTLTGPAGGHWSSGTGAESIVLDAIEFCRILSGRPTSSGQPNGLLTTQVPF